MAKHANKSDSTPARPTRAQNIAERIMKGYASNKQSQSMRRSLTRAVLAERERTRKPKNDGGSARA